MKRRKFKKHDQSYWDKVMAELDAEHPDIYPNNYQFIYAGSNDFWYDINGCQDPTEDWDRILDGEENEEPPPKDFEGIEKLSNKMIKFLPKKERQIVKLHLFENRSFAFIAREMGCTRQNIKYHFDKSMAMLRNKFNKKL
jgi:DNA-directed RNA polymerase specialized sigma subunit